MKKKIIVAVGALAALAVVGGTFAFYNQTAEVKNEFTTGDYVTSLTERFDPSKGKNWEPGATVSKVVWVNNTGDLPVIARIKLKDVWSREDTPFQTLDSTIVDDILNNMIKYVAGDGRNQLLVSDGKVEADKTVVAKTLTEGGQWKLAEDGWWYYMEIVEPGSPTGHFMDAVTLAGDIDLGKYSQKDNLYMLSESVTEPAEKVINQSGLNAWLSKTDYDKLRKEYTDSDQNTYYTYIKSESELTEDKGYADAKYELVVDAQMLQASPEVLKSMKLSTAGDSWAKIPSELETLVKGRHTSN